MTARNVNELSLPELSLTLARQPERWGEVRDRVQRMFDRIAPEWDSRIDRPDYLAPLQDALGRVAPPRRALDLGTGTGIAARLLAEHFPAAQVVGVDIAVRMIEQARAHDPDGRIDFRIADGASLPFADAAFDLVTAVNVFVFWEEVARVLAPGGTLLIEASMAEQTPIHVPFDEATSGLSRIGPFSFEHGRSGTGSWILARKGDDRALDLDTREGVSRSSGCCASRPRFHVELQQPLPGESRSGERGKGKASERRLRLRHATEHDLDGLEHLLQALRGTPGLHERKRGYFSRGSRAFLHFHADGSNLYADIRLAERFQRVRVTTAEEQAALLTHVQVALASKWES
jgi:SAM-dependent methyltransferase